MQKNYIFNEQPVGGHHAVAFARTEAEAFIGAAMQKRRISESGD